jgi:hypothetical protein
MENQGSYPGRYPAIVKSYDKVTRTCRVEIPGITDGGDVLPNAEIEYAIGDKSRTGANATEIEILAGDTIWVAFIGGDARYPLVTGYRNPSSGNNVDWRRFHHANIELTADGTLKLNAATIELNAANVNITGANLKHNSVSISSTHKHSGVQSGAGNTGNPV